MPEIKSAELGVESAELGVKIAQGGYFPTIGVGGSGFSNYVDQANFLGVRDDFRTQIGNNFSYSGNFQLNIPILSNMRNRANVQRARLQKRLSEIQEVETVNQLRQDITGFDAQRSNAGPSFGRSSNVSLSIEPTVEPKSTRLQSNSTSLHSK